MTFEELLYEVEPALQRYVHFQIGNRQDAEDILQETRFAAFRSFGSLKEQQNFRAWIIGIARRKCADYYRSRKPELPLDELPEDALTQSLHGLVTHRPFGKRSTSSATGTKRSCGCSTLRTCRRRGSPICSASPWARSKAACTLRNSISKNVIRIHRKEKKLCLRKCRK